MKDVARNKKAFHDYEILEKYEAGIALLGTEVKSLRDGKANLRDSYVLVRGGEAFLFNCHISPYSHGNIQNHEPTRTRKLLLSRRELGKLEAKIAQKGMSVLPLRIYFKGPRAKVEIGVGRGRKFFEKREHIKEREAKKEISRALKQRNK